jgi:S-methylmethionine-dependent homocysteine/selenocysteine methylase
MKEKIVIETKISELKDYDWLSYTLPDGDTQIINNDETIAAAAKAWKMTPEAVGAIKEALEVMAITIIESLEEDLRDIWKASK